MRHGTYVRGWKFDWEAARQDTDRLMAAERPIAAAACADPGCVTCPSCGESHWREAEVFLCARCEAEVTLDRNLRCPVVTQPPRKPEMVRSRYAEGMRVRWDPVLKTRRGKPNGGPWRVQLAIGQEGVIVANEGLLQWVVVWDHAASECGLLGDFVDDDFKVIGEAPHGD